MAFSIEDFYKDFGTDVVKEIRSQVELNGNLQPLLKRLGIPSLPGVADQHQALAGFIYRYGIAFFLKVAHSDLSYADVDRMKLEVLLSFRTSKPRSSSTQRTAAGYPPSPLKRRVKKPGEPTRWEIVGQAVSSDQAPPAAPSASAGAAPAPTAPRAPAEQATGSNRNVPQPVAKVSDPAVHPPASPAGHGQNVPAPPAQHRQEAIIVDVPTYHGPERRMTPDRRSGTPDRRQRVEIIFFKNRRFGGDRRKTVRRENDRLKLQGANPLDPRLRKS